MSIVRNNLLTIENYTPYCGSEFCLPRNNFPMYGERWPRTYFNGDQFCCFKCGWKSEFEKEFIEKYKQKWNK